MGLLMRIGTTPDIIISERLTLRLKKGYSSPTLRAYAVGLDSSLVPGCLFRRLVRVTALSLPPTAGAHLGVGGLPSSGSDPAWLHNYLAWHENNGAPSRCSVTPSSG